VDEPVNPGIWCGRFGFRPTRSSDIYAIGILITRVVRR